MQAEELHAKPEDQCKPPDKERSAKSVVVRVYILSSSSSHPGPSLLFMSTINELFEDLGRMRRTANGRC